MVLELFIRIVVPAGTIAPGADRAARAIGPATTAARQILNFFMVLDLLINLLGGSFRQSCVLDESARYLAVPACDSNGAFHYGQKRAHFITSIQGEDVGLGHWFPDDLLIGDDHG